MKKLMMLAAMTVIVATLPLTAASASDDDRGVYLALGDSVAAGTQNPEPFTDDGYADVLFQRTKDDLGLTELVNLSCPGDDTYEFRSGDDGPDGGSLCYGAGAPFNYGAPSQLDAAVAYLGANPGEVELITLTIGANDLFRCGPAPTPECVTGAVNGVVANLAAIVPTLQEAAPGVPIVAMNYYNPNLAHWLTPGSEEFAARSNQLVIASNEALEAIYATFDVPVADVESAFRTTDDRAQDVPRNVGEICKYTGMCARVEGSLQVRADHDIHPNDLGHRRIARAFIDTMTSTGTI